MFVKRLWDGDAGMAVSDLHQSTIHPTKETNVPDTMIDTRVAPTVAASTGSPVAAALAALIKALKVEAVDGDFTRTTGFLRRAEDMAQRWQDGRPAHTPRTKAE